MPRPPSVRADQHDEDCQRQESGGATTASTAARPAVACVFGEGNVPEVFQGGRTLRMRQRGFGLGEFLKEGQRRPRRRGRENSNQSLKRPSAGGKESHMNRKEHGNGKSQGTHQGTHPGQGRQPHVAPVKVLVRKGMMIQTGEFGDCEVVEVTRTACVARSRDGSLDAQRWVDVYVCGAEPDPQELRGPTCPAPRSRRLALLEQAG